MADKPQGPAHAGHALASAADNLAAAHAAVVAGQADAVAAHVAELTEGRMTKTARREARLADIEQRNKHAASHPELTAG